MMGLLSLNIKNFCQACSPMFWAGRAIDRRIAAYQNELMERHCDEVQNIYKTMRGWRHDYHNHIQALLALTEEPVRLREYLQ